MAILYIMFLCVMATAKVTVQGLFGKKNVRTLSDAVFFNGLIFLFSALVFFKDAFSASLPTVLFGAAFGFFSMLFQMTYIKAMSMGNVSITVMLVNFSIVLPVVVSCVYYGEELTPLRLIGMALIAFSFVISTNFKSDRAATGKWVTLALLATLTNGILGLIQKMFASSSYSGETQGYVAWGYIAATAFSVLLYLIMTFTGNEKSFPTSRSVFGYAFATGIILGVFQFFFARGVSAIDGMIFFPTYAGLAIIFSALSGVILFRDRLSPKQMIGIACGTVAVVLMNI